MKLTLEQDAAVRQLVENEVEYYETFHEVYDHVITSLEEKETIHDLQKAYADILERDFGGHGGLEKMEADRRWNIWKETSQHKLIVFYGFFKWPGVLVLILFGIGYYYGFHYHNFRLVLFIGSFVLTVLPFLIMGTGDYIVKLKIGEAKSSINSISINSIANRIWKYLKWYLLYNIICSLIPLKYIPALSRSTSQIIGSVILGCLFFCIALYVMATIIVYKRELNKRLAL